MQTLATVPLAARRKLAFAFDSMGRRIRKTVWHGTSGGGWQLQHKFDFIHELNGWNILGERSGGSIGSFLRTYSWGTDLSGSLSGAGGVGGLLFTKLHTSNTTVANGMDLNGNVTLLVKMASGQVAATYDYGPFGEPLRQSGEYATLNPFRFSTKYTDDESGFVDYGLRPYIPSLGRWPSRDPIEEEGGINLYGFVGNDGISRVDYLGSYSCDTSKPRITEVDSVEPDGSINFDLASLTAHKLDASKPSALVTWGSPCGSSFIIDMEVTKKPTNGSGGESIINNERDAEMHVETRYALLHNGNEAKSATRAKFCCECRMK